MSTDKKFILKLEEILPELVTAKDLVKIGIYRTEQAAYSARQKGKSPPYIRIPSRGIVYPKQGIIDFLEKHWNEVEDESEIRNGLNSHSNVATLKQNALGNI